MQSSVLGSTGDPATRIPGVVVLSAVDFNRGNAGAGRLTLRFDHEGAAPNMRVRDGGVVIDIGDVAVAAALQRQLNVSDFATPVRQVNTIQSGSSAHVVLDVQGEFEPMAYQSGRDYVVEIAPRASSAGRAVASNAQSGIEALGSASGRSREERVYTGSRVNLDFQDIPVRTVLQLIATDANLNIVASDSVTGSITLNLTNVPWDQALDIVLRAKSLDMRRNGNVIWIAPQSDIARDERELEDARLAMEERVEMVTEYIPISYGNAEEIARLLTEESRGNSSGSGAGGGNRSGFLSSRGSLSFDRRTNTLLVIDIPNRISEIHRLVEMLDKPVDQVVIEARIVVASESFARDIGARFGVRGSDWSGDRLRGVVSGSLDSNVNYVNTLIEDGVGEHLFPTGLLFNNAASSAAGAGALALTILSGSVNWDIELSALQEEGRGEVISNPRIITSNQREARISQGQEVGYLTVTGGTGDTRPSVEFKDILLELRVTPTITNDGRVFLVLDIKKDEINGWTSMGDFGSIPSLNTREVTTAVLIEDGQTVSIGGVYEFRSREDLTKVPFLADLPVLGNLFKRRQRENEKAELLVFVTPRVLRVAPR